jgi:hypothetical protein
MYLTRLNYNAGNWQGPTGDARRLESGQSYNRKYGFGLEDWLFRTEWLIGGWRYGFFQGANKSYARLVDADAPFDVTLFTIDPEKRRRYVATIYEAECLTNSQAEAALQAFKRLGWYDLMQAEIRSTGGDPSAMNSVPLARHILNVRFRQENVRPFPAGTYAEPGDPVLLLKHYQLADAEKLDKKHGKAAGGRQSGSASLPNVASHVRRISAIIEYTPEHQEMQKRLMLELKAEFPRARIVREEHGVDVAVETSQEKILFEIKSDLEPRTVIRHALGQILEYAYHPRRTHPRPLRLVIVGRHGLGKEEQAYLERLTGEIGLPLAYRVVPVFGDEQSTFEQSRMEFDDYCTIFRKLKFAKVTRGRLLRHPKFMCSMYLNKKQDGFVYFTAQARDLQLYSDAKIWVRLPPQQVKDKKENFITVVPVRGMEEQAFTVLLKRCANLKVG